MKVIFPILILILYSCGGGGSSSMGSNSYGTSNSNSSTSSSSGSSTSQSSATALSVSVMSITTGGDSGGDYGGSYGSSSSSSDSISVIQIENADQELNMGGNATSSKKTVYAYSEDFDDYATYEGTSWPRVRFSESLIQTSASVTANVSKLPSKTSDGITSTDVVGINYRPAYQCMVDMTDSEAGCSDDNWRLFLSDGKVDLKDVDVLPEVDQTFAVTVQSTASGNKYYIDGVLADNISLEKGKTYAFNLGDAYSSHPMRLSISQDGIHSSKPEFIKGVQSSTTNKTILFTVPQNAPAKLYYFCYVHSGMANEAEITIN